MDGKEDRGILGKDKRYNAIQVINDPSTKKYFIDVFSKHIKKTDNVLDFGCGPGSFLCAIASFCGEITGVDISKGFAESSSKTIDELKLDNAKAIHIEPDTLPFDNECFDVIIMVDIIHHLENIDKSLTEAFRVLRPGGKVLILEPNKLNPLIALVHVFDRNEWGLLKTGTPGIYKKILHKFISINEISFNGIVIGPQSKLFRLLSDIMNSKLMKPIIGWLNPKMFIMGTKK